MTKMMFLYESLKDHEKQAISDVVEKGVKRLILDKRSFDYSESEFFAMVNKLAIKNKEIDRLLGGNDIPYFNLKATIINCKALKVAYDIEHSKPTLERLEHLVRLCVELEEETHTNMLFDGELVDELIYAYRFKKIDRNIPNKSVDLKNVINYTINSNTIWFVKTMYELHKSE